MNVSLRREIIETNTNARRWKQEKKTHPSCS